MSNTAAYLLAAFLALGLAAESGAASALDQIGEFTVPEANQGVGVDARHFYAVDNYVDRQVRQEDRQAREEVAGRQEGPRSCTSTARCSWTASSTPRTPITRNGR